MEYQKITNSLDDTAINHLNLEQEIGSKQMMNQKEIMIIVILVSKQPQ